MLEDKDLISIQQARQLARRASEALASLKELNQEQVDAVVAAMARAAENAAPRLAEMAVEETGYGNVRDKTIKNLFAAVDVHRHIKDLKTCGVIAENKSKKVIDIAVPAGVIAAIIPTTNPTSTTIFKVLCALKGRNAVVLSPHPNALNCTVETGKILYEAARRAGAAEHCISWMTEVSLEGTRELMSHPATNLILATGGAGLVRAAYSSGKPAYGVGPGNVPAFIERTANVAKAVRDVIAGKTFDFGVLCSSEQALVYDRSIEDKVMKELGRNNAYLVEGRELEKLERLLQDPSGRLNTAVVGKSPQVIAQLAGFSVGQEVSCLVGRAGGVGPEHPLSMEKLSPVLALYAVDGWQEGCERCIEILNFGGLGHTMAIHSSDNNVIMEFGLHKPAYRVCVNTPATHGSVGLTTGVPPSMTLGCGTPGGNITSDNITPRHLINIRRVAFETRSTDQIHYPSLVPSPQVSNSQLQDTALREAVRGVVAEYLEQKKKTPDPGPRPPQEPVPAPPVPLRVEPPTPQRPQEPAVDFVCEDDVRRALSEKRKIIINQRTILTPSARDLGRDKNVFLRENND